MKTYRLFPVGESGHILGPPREMNAEDDRAVVRTASDWLDDGPVELWDGSRYIASLTRNPATARSDWIIVVKD